MRRRTGVPAVLSEHALDPRSRKRRCTESVQHARVERSTTHAVIQTSRPPDIQTSRQRQTDTVRYRQRQRVRQTDRQTSVMFKSFSLHCGAAARNLMVSHRRSAKERRAQRAQAKTRLIGSIWRGCLELAGDVLSSLADNLCGRSPTKQEHEEVCQQKDPDIPVVLVSAATQTEETEPSAVESSVDTGTAACLVADGLRNDRCTAHCPTPERTTKIREEMTQFVKWTPSGFMIWARPAMVNTEQSSRQQLGKATNLQATDYKKRGSWPTGSDGCVKQT